MENQTQRQKDKVYLFGQVMNGLVQNVPFMTGIDHAVVAMKTAAKSLLAITVNEMVEAALDEIYKEEK